MTSDRRKSIFRRDLNDLVRGPDGKVSEAKAYAVAFKGLMFYTFFHYTDKILGGWEVFSIFVTAFLAPDLLKKALVLRSERKEK